MTCARCGRPIDGPLADGEHGAYVHAYDCQSTPVCACCGMGGVVVFQVDEMTGVGVLVHGRCGACGWKDIYAADLSPHSFNPMMAERREIALRSYREEHDIPAPDAPEEGVNVAHQSEPAGSEGDGEGRPVQGSDG